MSYVNIDEIVEKMNLENLAPEISTEGIKVRQTEVNRPALELTGYFDHFAAGRIQLIGLVEHSYIEQMDEESERAAFEKLFSLDVPMVIFTRGMYPDDIILEIGRKHGMPMYLTTQATSPFMAEILRWLNVRLAPCISIHGVLVDVYGIGVLLTGDSGIGKSEAALELIKRGHRLVSDDVVEIRKVSEVTLIGIAPPITKHLSNCAASVSSMSRPCSVSPVSATARVLIWRSIWKSGTRTGSTTGSEWRTIIRNIWATRWSATVFRSGRAEMLLSSVRLRRPITARNSWAIMPRMSCTRGCRRISGARAERKTMKTTDLPLKQGQTCIYAAQMPCLQVCRDSIGGGMEET